VELGHEAPWQSERTELAHCYETGRMRFSISTLLLVTIPIAASCAALGTGSRWLADTIFNIVTATLVFSILAAIFRTDERRIFWAGFATFGWCYWLMAFGPGFSDDLKSPLVTTQLRSNVLIPYWQPYAVARRLVKSWSWNEMEAFLDLIVHSFFSLVIALAGGLVASLAFSKPRAGGSGDAEEP
jgi:hypothetical protein